MHSYHRTAIQDLEDIRVTLKHTDRVDIDTSAIRDRLGPIIADLEVLSSLRRPRSYKLVNEEDGTVTITIEMNLDEGGAEDMVRKLWLDQ